MNVIDVHQAVTRFDEMLERVVCGEQFVISQAGKPVAKLIGYRTNNYDRAGSQWKGLVRVGPDFNDPLPT